MKFHFYSQKKFFKKIETLRKQKVDTGITMTSQVTLNNRIKVWSNVVHIDIDKLNVISNPSLHITKLLDNSNMSLKEMKSWKIRKDDRSDYKDWMPIHVDVPGHEIRTSYVNVNPSSDKHAHTLVLRLAGAGTVPFFHEFDDKGNPIGEGVISVLL